MRIAIVVQLALLAMFPQAIRAADLNVAVALDKAKALIGDPLKYSLIITADTALRVDSVSLNGRLTDFEVRSWSIAQERVNGPTRTVNYEGVIAPFKTGRVTIPRVPVTYHPAEGGPDALYADSLSISVQSLVANDSTADIRSLKDARQLGSHSLLYWLLVPVALLLLAGVIWARTRKRGAQAQVAPIDLGPPWEQAFRRLKELRRRSADGEVTVKSFYVELSELVRVYVQQRFGFAAPEMTTFQIVQEVNSQGFVPEQGQLLISLLEGADLVKFAKLVPTGDEVDQDFQKAWSFVTQSIPSAQATGVRA